VVARHTQPDGFWKRLEARNQNRLANFVRPQLQPDEQIVAILSRLFERLSQGGPSGPMAAVVTNQRLIVIRLGTMTERPKKILVAHSRDGLKVEWIRYAHAETGPYFRGGGWMGKLSVAGSAGSNELWVGGVRLDQAEAIAKALE
jgi:hypothetical protein